MGGEDILVALTAISPQLILVAATVLCIAADLFMRSGKDTACWAVSVAGCAAALWASASLWGRQQVAFSQLVRLDKFSLFFYGIFLVAGIMTLVLSMEFLRRERMPVGEYCAILLVSISGMMFMASAYNLLMVFLGLELMSIPVYVMAALMKRNPKSTESAIKYLLLGAFASALLLYGIALIYSSARSTSLGVILKHLETGRLLGNPVLLAGMGLVIAGVGFKVSLVPFHMWTPDVYEGAPTPVTAFMSAGIKAAGFAVLIRVVVVAMHRLSIEWAPLLWVLAALTMIVGNVVALSQQNIKRMLAYSSIAHAGYVLVALTPGTRLGIQAALMYLFIYFIMNLGAFGVVIALSGKGDTAVDIQDYRGRSAGHPLYAAAMAVFMFSLAGVPPTGGFVGKFYAFSAAVKAGYIWLAVIGVLMSAVSAFFYLRVLVRMYMEEAEVGTAVEPIRPLAATRPAGIGLCVAFAALALLFLGTMPSLLARVAEETLAGLWPF